MWWRVERTSKATVDVGAKTAIRCSLPGELQHHDKPRRIPANTPSTPPLSLSLSSILTIFPLFPPILAAESSMDSLVAQYTRPAFADEGQTHEEQHELLQASPELSLKFALPPVAQVSRGPDDVAQTVQPGMLTASSPPHGFAQ